MHNITRRKLVWYAMVASAAIAVDRSHATESSVPVTHEVRIAGLKFQPDVLVVKPGDSIMFINDDIAPHTATAKDKSWDTGKLKKGESAIVEVSEGFAAAYFCRYHPKMKGTADLASAD